MQNIKRHRFESSLNNSTAKNLIVQGPEFSFTPDPRGVGSYFFEKLEEHGEKICQICSITGRTETFSSVKLRSTRVAIHMRKLNIVEQDVVLLCHFNTLDSVIPILATQFLGCVSTSLDPSSSVKDMTHLVRLVKPKLIFACRQSVGDIKMALQNADIESQLVVINDEVNFQREDFQGKNKRKNYICQEEGCLKFSIFLEPSDEEESFCPLVVNNRKNAFIMFSSGTTGAPKGVCVSGYSIIYATMSLLAMGIDYHSIYHSSSFYWITAVNLTFAGIITGGQRVLSPKFDESTCFKMIQDYNVSYAFLSSPYIYKLHEANISPYETSNFTMCTFGGGSIGGNQLKRIQKLLPHTKVTIAYGMTEVCGFLSGYHRNKDAGSIEERIMSSGYPAPGVKMKVIDLDTETQLGPYEKGELRVLCQSFFTDYHNGNKEQAFDKTGWFKTGDIAYFDDKNFLYVIDRIKEMFKYKSWHIVPSSLEAVVLEHPAAQETIVLGIPHEKDGHHPVALVVLKKDEIASPDEIERFVDERVADCQRLRGGVRIVKQFVKTPTGKILRKAMREKVLSGEI